MLYDSIRVEVFLVFGIFNSVLFRTEGAFL